MKIANIAEFKDHLSRYIALVEQGEEIELCKRNVPVARIIPSRKEGAANKTRLGSGLNSVTIKTDLTEPAFSFDDWHMLKRGRVKLLLDTCCIIWTVSDPSSF